MSGECPDGGTCHHGCAEHWNGACWRVFNASPLSEYGERWPREVKDAQHRRMMEGRMPPRRDGLTQEEGEVMDALVVAVRAFGRLPLEHPADPREFVDAIHRCQQLLALRLARRSWPGGWPTPAKDLAVRDNGERL